METVEIVAVLLFAVCAVTLAGWKLVEKWEAWRSERKRARQEDTGLFRPKSPEE
jgi:hypothetical protein